MNITRKSMFTKVEHTLDLDITVSEREAFVAGEKVQNAFPRLTPAEREFILTGVTPEEWEAEFPPGEQP